MGEICTSLRWFIPFYRVRRENSDAEPLALWIKSHIIGKARPARLLGKTLGLDHPQKWKVLYLIDRPITNGGLPVWQISYVWIRRIEIWANSSPGSLVPVAGQSTVQKLWVHHSWSFRITQRWKNRQTRGLAQLRPSIHILYLIHNYSDFTST